MKINASHATELIRLMEMRQQGHEQVFVPDAGILIRCLTCSHATLRLLIPVAPPEWMGVSRSALMAPVFHPEESRCLRVAYLSAAPATLSGPIINTKPVLNGAFHSVVDFSPALIF